MTQDEVEAATKEVQGHACELRYSMTSGKVAYVDELRKDLSKSKIEIFFDQWATTVDEDGLWDLVVSAREGNSRDETILCAVAIRRLGCDRDFPQPLHDYVSSMLQKRLSTLRAPRRGRQFSSNAQRRDYQIFLCVANLLDRFEALRATRNPVAKRGAASACSIVREGFSRAKFSLSETRVNEIWRAESERLKWRRRTY